MVVLYADADLIPGELHYRDGVIEIVPSEIDDKTDLSATGSTESSTTETDMHAIHLPCTTNSCGDGRLHVCSHICHLRKIAYES